MPTRTTAPEIALIDPNTLCCMGLKALLESIIPQAVVRCFGSFGELTDDTPDMYVHYFVSSSVLLEHTAFFLERRHKTMVLTAGTSSTGTFSNFHTLDVTQPEATLVRALLRLHEGAHAHRHYPGHPMPPGKQESEADRFRLSPRETEVLVLLVRGLINKEIADRLHISLTTVISHRKNITEKLGIRSLSGLTVYAVMNGLVEANQI